MKRMIWAFGIITVCHLVLAYLVAIAECLNGLSFGQGPSGPVWKGWCQVIDIIAKTLLTPARLIGPNEHWILLLIGNSVAWGVALTAIYAVWKMKRKRSTEPATAPYSEPAARSPQG